MDTITSTIGFRRVLMLVYYILLALFGIWLCRLVFRVNDFHSFPPYMLLFMGLSFFAMAIYGFVWDHRNVYKVSMDTEMITLGRRGTFYWSDLEHADLKVLRHIGRSNYKAVLLQFKNEKPVYLYYFAYGNIREMRDHLQQFVIV